MYPKVVFNCASPRTGLRDWTASTSRGRCNDDGVLLMKDPASLALWVLPRAIAVSSRRICTAVHHVQHGCTARIRVWSCSAVFEAAAGSYGRLERAGRRQALLGPQSGAVKGASQTRACCRFFNLAFARPQWVGDKCLARQARHRLSNPSNQSAQSAATSLAQHCPTRACDHPSKAQLGSTLSPPCARFPRSLSPPGRQRIQVRL